MYETTTRPPGRVTRTSSSVNRHGAGTCSTTLEEKHTSTDPDATGSRSPRPATAAVPAGRGPRSSPGSASSATYRAPAAANAAANCGGPAPTSSTVRPASGPCSPTSATESRASSP